MLGQKGRKKQSRNSNYKNRASEEDGANGLRAKLTFALAANGKYAPITVSVCGLTEAELSKEECPSGVLLLAIEGICVGNGNDIGYLMLVRNDNNGITDKTRYKTYRGNSFSHGSKSNILILLAILSITKKYQMIYLLCSGAMAILLK